MRRDGGGGFLDFVGIAQVVVSDRGQVVFELVDERNARGNVQPDDVVVGDVVEVLHQRPETVAVGGDENAFTARDVGRDRFLPIG